MKEKFEKSIGWLGLAILILVVFKSWFGQGELVAGDAPFFFEESLKDFSFFPFSWSYFGLGEYQPVLTSFFYLLFPIKLLALLNFPWTFIERLLWYWPFIFLAVFSSWYFLKTVFPKVKWAFLGPLIYLFNTYILMVIGGGQISIALAYAIFPLTLALFLKSISKNINQKKAKLQLISGLVLSLQVAFEPRIGALALLAAFLFAFFEYRLAILRYLKSFLIPLLVFLGLHFYWLMPLLVLKKQAYSSALASLDWAEFLSFADFSNSFSLLHPNWPENIFGKTYFMKPEFLILPILAFSSLFFIFNLKDKKIKRNLLTLALLALAGAFLGKGAKSPFGGFYLWLYENVPGVNLFRDPTKFYVLTALAFSTLIPFSLTQIEKRLKKQFKVRYLISGLFAVYFLFLVQPAWLDGLQGTFRSKNIPREYLALKGFIHDQDEFFRTLWIPQKHRLGYQDSLHPAIKADELPSQEELSAKGVKYVIVPHDSEGEIFLEDRKYSHQKRLELEERLEAVAWLKKTEVIDRLAIFETPNHQDRFFVTQEKGPEINWKMINPTKYLVMIKDASQPFQLFFSETYDQLWQAKTGERAIFSKESYNNLNTFYIDQTGDFEVVVEFTAQRYLNYGLMITMFSLFFSLVLIAYLWGKK